MKANAARLPSTTRDAPTWRFRYKPQGPVMAQFHRRRYHELVRVVIGPLGSSKTYGAISEILMMAHDQTPDKQNRRRSRWCIARNSFPDLNAATIPDVRGIVDRINPDGWNMQAPISWKHEYKRDDGTTVEVELLFRSFDGPQDVKKARGMQLTGAWVDELGEFNKENFDMLIGRVKRFPSKAENPNAKWGVIGTSNAVARDHWMAESALGIKQEAWWFGIQPGGVKKVGNKWVLNEKAENLNNLPDGYYLDQCSNKKESWIRQNLANEFVVHTDGRPVHPDFNEQLHVGELAPTYGRPLHVGIDFGRTPAAVIMQRQSNGQWYVLDELVTENMGALQFGRILKTLLNDKYSGFQVEDITGDPAGSQMAQTRDETPFDMLEAAGMEALPAHTNDFEVRTETLDSILNKLIAGEPAIMIDTECTVLIRGLAGEYQFRRLQVTGREIFQDKPDKGPTSHVCEALHYGLMGAGESDTLFDQNWGGMAEEEILGYASSHAKFYE